MTTTVSLRELIRERLAQQVPAFGGNVSEPQAADAGTAQGLPFAEVRLGAEPMPTPYGARAYQAQVWVYQPITGQSTSAGYTALDNLNAQVVAALDRVVLTEPQPVPPEQGAPDQAGLLGDSYLLRYSGTAFPDEVVEQVGALCRPLVFRVAGLRWRGYGADPILTTLAQWTAQVLPQAQTDPLVWVPADAAPAVFWRVAGGASVVEMQTFVSRWLAVPIVGHVECPDPDARDVWLSQVTTALAGTAVYGIPRADGQGFIRVARMQSNARADPILEGQISLSMRLLQVDALPVQPGAITTTSIGSPIETAMAIVGEETGDP